MTDLGQLNTAIQNNPATVVYFTSATCPPCRIIAPIYDELVLSKGKQIFGVKVDIGMAQAIGRAYEVRSTPTFMFFLKGKKFSQFSGANQAELRSSSDLLIYSAHPGKKNVFLLQLLSCLLAHKNCPLFVQFTDEAFFSSSFSPSTCSVDT